MKFLYSVAWTFGLNFKLSFFRDNFNIVFTKYLNCQKMLKCANFNFLEFEPCYIRVWKNNYIVLVLAFICQKMLVLLFRLHFTVVPLIGVRSYASKVFGTFVSLLSEISWIICANFCCYKFLPVGTEMAEFLWKTKFLMLSIFQTLSLLTKEPLFDPWDFKDVSFFKHFRR